jgi:hypothetical protein
MDVGQGSNFTSGAVYLGEIQMRGCRPVLVKDGREVPVDDIPAAVELMRRVAQRVNREKRETN